MIVLRDARNVKYGAFMDPGNRMEVKVELIERTDSTATFKGSGSKNGQSTVNARFTVATYNLASLEGAPLNVAYASKTKLDENLILAHRQRASLIWTGTPLLG
jgi:hypothetical protein